MQVAYSIEKLADMAEVDLKGVSLETAASCPVCDSSNGLIEVGHLRASLLTSRCDRCGHLFHRTRPGAAWYADWYRSSWDGAQVRQNTPAASPAPGARLRTLLEQRLRAAKRALLPSDTYHGAGRELFEFCRPVLGSKDWVLDVGCGYGGHLLPFIELGCSVFGIEASPHRAQAAAKSGVRTVNVPVESLDASTFSTRFNLVFSNHVFEHVYDPHAFLAAVARVLTPGGWICLTVPNQDHDFLLQQFFFALHIHCFSASSLNMALRRHGFVTHRMLQEHQLRVLAQYRPSEASANTDRLSGTLRTAELTDAIAKLTLGEQYEQRGGREVFCQWSPDPRATRSNYCVEYSAERPPSGDRVLKLAWSGAKSLPLEFVRAGAPEQAVPFWTK